MKDRHVGHTTSPITADPENFIGLIRTHGVLARIEQARLCTCYDSTGNADWHCPVCNGDGIIYTFQRKLLQADEDSDQNVYGTEIYPFRVPILEPITVERLLPTEQGGILTYTITGFDAETIHITGNPLPKTYERRRVSYYFDRFETVMGDTLEIDPVSGHLYTRQTRYDDGHRSSNVFNVHGDIVEILKIYDMTGNEYTDYTFCRNEIHLKQPLPADCGDIRADYRFVPPAPVLTADIETKTTEELNWSGNLISGDCRIAVEPWYDLAKGDIITLLTPTLFKNELIQHNAGYDKLFELDIFTLDDVIIGNNGKRYYQGTDFVLKNRRGIAWVGKEPEPGTTLSVRYGYHPAFVVFENNPIPNMLENKIYPKILYAKFYSKTKAEDMKRIYA